jgi:phosphoenolpyruvate carboxylase
MARLKPIGASEHEADEAAVVPSGPLLPAALAVFPEATAEDPARLEQRLAGELARLAEQGDVDPFTNPIQQLAAALLRSFDQGRLTPAAAEQLIQRLTIEAFIGRAARLARYLGECDPAANLAELEALVRGLAGTPPRSFEEFRTTVERELFGFVITAHPTFALSAEQLRIAASLAAGRDADGAPLTEEGRAALIRRAAQTLHRPDAGLDLRAEHALSIEVLGRILAAIRRLYESVFTVAAEFYPERWTELTPRLITLASWVGYDLDGRSDIRWNDSLYKRMKLQALQLARYRGMLDEIQAGLGASAPEALRESLARLERQMVTTVAEVDNEIALFERFDATTSAWHRRLEATSRRMQGQHDKRLVHPQAIVAELTAAMALAPDKQTAQRLCVLRAELANHGLGLAHTHVRLNAAQIHNAIRKTIGMESAADDPSRRRSYQGAVNDLLREVAPVQINFGSILAERSSAKRLFMLVAQMLKHVDAATPVRLLIAECETSFTLLTALYFARLFDVADRLDISPLLETAKAFERGVRMIDDCLQNPHYAAYLRKRGRLCIQTGFSDAGRYMGQTTVAATVELVRMRLAALLAERGFADIELVIFDTHGESIGRGAHPASFADRLAYVASPVSRRRFAEHGIAVKQEVSFQGGDGWLHFLNPAIALATVTRATRFALVQPGEAAADPFYEDYDYVTEFFITVRQFNERVMGDPAYAALLDLFGVNMLYPAGSRALKREHETAQRTDLAHPSQLRAIPHNSILQQLGLLANTLGGVGQAVAKDPERFQRLYRDSPRFRRILGMVEWALAFSDLDVLKAYVDIFDPGLWRQQAAHPGATAPPAELRQVADWLERAGFHERLMRIFRVLQKDVLELKTQLAACRGQAGPPDDMAPGISAEARANLQILHALRIALIQRLFLLATHIPDFSDRHGVTPEELIGRVLHLDIEPAVRLLAVIFPKTDAGEAAGDFGEPATYASDANQSYELEHLRIFQPMAGLHELMRRVSAGVIHTIGALG